mmetsp:Transcript_16216/g.24054  ORF Transcript_16216/g.24054 Transcript_16216/m.24054 type:complete len:242 (+) Transcript_16216:107-832(+)
MAKSIMGRSDKSIMGRSRKKSSSKKQKRVEEEVQTQDDEQTASTEDTQSELTEETPLVEKISRRQRKAERKQFKSPTNLWSDLNLMCGGCCGAMEVIEPAEDDEDFFADDDDNIISKFGHSIMHKAGFAPPVKIIKCTPLDDDTVITTPRVLIELAKQYDKERFWVTGGTVPNDEDGTVTTSKTNFSAVSSMSKRLLPSISFPSGRSRASKSVRSFGGKKAKKSKDALKKPLEVSDGRFEI